MENRYSGISFWEQQSFLNYDCLIVGSGIVGLSAASRIKEQWPQKSVLVLERGMFPSGASTKNAGFACFGSPTELLSDLEGMSEAEVLDLVSLRWQGLGRLKARLGNNGIGLINHGGYELISENEMHCLDKIDYLNKMLAPIFDAPVYALRDDLLPVFGFGKKIKHLIANQFEAQIDTGLMMRSLIEYAGKLGIRLMNSMKVTRIVPEEHSVKVWVANGAGEETAFVAGQVGVCTNAFAQQIFPSLYIKPGRGLVLATKPIKNLPFKGVFHFDEGYFYFRNHGDRVIFGGGRNLDFEGETTTEFGVNPAIYAKLGELLKEVVLPKHDAEIETVWSGIMAFGQVKKPIEESLSPRLHLGVRMGGMGVAIGSAIGENLADKMGGGK